MVVSLFTVYTENVLTTNLKLLPRNRFKLKPSCFLRTETVSIARSSAKNFSVVPKNRNKTNLVFLTLKLKLL